MAYGDFKEVSHIAKFIKPSAHRGVLTKREWKKSQKSTQVDTRKEYKEKLAFKELTSPPKPEGASKPKNYRQYKKERVGTYKEYTGELGIKSKGILAQLTSSRKNRLKKSTGYKQTNKRTFTEAVSSIFKKKELGGSRHTSSGNCLAGECTP